MIYLYSVPRCEVYSLFLQATEQCNLMNTTLQVHTAEIGKLRCCDGVLPFLCSSQLNDNHIWMFWFFLLLQSTLRVCPNILLYSIGRVIQLKLVSIVTLLFVILVWAIHMFFTSEQTRLWPYFTHLLVLYRVKTVTGKLCAAHCKK